MIGNVAIVIWLSLLTVLVVGRPVIEMIGDFLDQFRG
jgi:hypothetical protein